MTAASWLDDFEVSMSLLRRMSGMRLTSEEQTFPRHVSVLRIRSGKGLNVRAGILPGSEANGRCGCGQLEELL